MRYSQLFGKTIREVSQEVRSKGHEYLLRGGYLRESSSGRMYLLPLGLQVQERVLKIVQEEMNRVGCQQMLAPVLHPRELWEETNRTESVSFELMQVQDRSGRAFVLGGTAEEMMVALVRQYALSERDLPFCIYQFSTKFRDELRARGGLLRAREFLMKDAYSFHSSRDDFERFYERMGKSYLTIFEQLGLSAHLVAAGNGYMGGDYSHEVIVQHEVGESRYLVSDDGAYCAHEDVAEFERERMNAEESVRAAHVVAAHRGPTIADGMQLYGAPAWRQIKSLIYVTDTNEKVLVSLRGDLEVSEAKLLRAVGCDAIRLATEQEVAALGSVVGFVSPLRLALRKFGDLSLTTVTNFVTGADAWQQDTVDVNYGRDFEVDVLCDLAVAHDGHRTKCGQILRERRGIEVGNIFQLGTWYSDRMKGAAFTSSDGNKRPFYMGCYGLGIGRTIATLAEIHHDEHGLLWPSTAAPYDVHILQLGPDEKVKILAEDLYSRLRARGRAVLFDDRNVSAGVKFSDADLIGIPERIIISPRLTAVQQVEVHRYRSLQKSIVAADAV